MSKGTVLYVGNFELPDKGASANRVMANRLLLNKAGYHVAFLGVTKEASFDAVRLSDYDCDIYERSYPTSIREWLARSYSVKNIVEIANKFDDLKAVMLYNTPFSLVRAVYMHYRTKGIKVLYDCTEWNPDTDGGYIKRLYKIYDAKKIRCNLEKYTDGLIIVSSLMHKQYKKRPKLLLPPLVDTSAPMWRQERTREDGVFEFCYAGDPENKDDMCLLIDAFSDMPSNKTRLRIIGITKDGFLSSYPEYKEKTDKIGGRLIFMGRISHEKVIKALINTDCFIFIRPSNLRNNAGFPTKFVEAYTSAVQVIATDISDIRDYRNDCVHLLERCDIDTVVKAMTSAMDTKNIWGIRDTFDFRQYVKKTTNFMDSVIK